MPAGVYPWRAFVSPNPIAQCTGPSLGSPFRKLPRGISPDLLQFVRGPIVGLLHRNKFTGLLGLPASIPGGLAIENPEPFLRFECSHLSRSPRRRARRILFALAFLRVRRY